MCLRRVAFKRKGLEVTPNKTRANLYSTILGSAEFTSSTHRKRRTSLSSFLTAIMRKAFSMSATNAIGWTLNLTRMSRMSGVRGGPVCRQSFNAGPFSKKNGVFLFAISFFNLEIFTFLYYANEGSDDVIKCSTKTVQHSIKNISGNIKAVFLKLGTRNVHHKRNKMTAVMALP